MRCSISLGVVWLAVVLAAGYSSAPVRAADTADRKDQPSQGADPAVSPAPTVRDRTTPQPPYQAPVNFRWPRREYETKKLHHWTVYVEKQLVQEDPELARKAVERLEHQLAELLRLFPKSSHKQFAQLKLFLMFGERSAGGGRDNGLEYFQRRAPQHYADLDPRMGSSILIYSADNYVWLPERRALMALAHEFAHAYQLEQWPENEPDIYDTWERAMHHGLYHNVKDDNGRLLPAAYATVNQLEYFAELSMVYFVGGYYTPFQRDELQTYDAAGYEMVRRVWRLDSTAPIESTVSLDTP